MSNSSIQALRRMPLAALVLLLPLLVSGCGRGDSTGSALPAAKTVQASSSALMVLDITGNAIDPFDATDAKAIVFIFISTDCPISNRYAPEIRRVEEKFARSGVRFWLVYADADTSPDAIRKHLKDYHLPQQVLRDPRQRLVHLAQARVTPEGAVFLPGRRLVYHGRIDNRYADLGKERPEATQHDLEEVLKAIVQGKPVPYSTAKAVGCYIPEAK
jgi:hypothetical protein